LARQRVMGLNLEAAEGVLLEEVLRAVGLFFG
jgi:hypothetical protein